MLQNRNHILIVLLTITALLWFFVDLSSGSVRIPLSDTFKALTGQDSAKTTWDYIILNYRLPKALTAVLAGIGLSVCGLLMQTLFRNPLAGPYVLGLSSGASLGVAIVVLGINILPISFASYLESDYIVVLASCIGSMIVLAAVLLVSQRLRDTMGILIVGLMFASFTSAVVSVFTYFSTAEQLQRFTFWSLGNLGSMTWESIIIMTSAVAIGLILCLFSIKPLNALLLGENYAQSLGINIRKTRILILLTTGILAGSITAFVGPIAFVGLAVPHIAKLVFSSSDHKILLIGTILCGANIMLVCDILSQVPGSDFTLPINAVTSLFGAPVVIWLLLRQTKMQR
ncbi:MAG: iron ABC transporter permease [Flavobacterium sp.]|nr:iron ABC transporter permease [Flavobacterium sp.]